MKNTEDTTQSPILPLNEVPFRDQKFKARLLDLGLLPKNWRLPENVFFRDADNDNICCHEC